MRLISLLFLSLFITNNTFANDYTNHLNNEGFFRCVPKLTVSPVEVINFETGSRETLGIGQIDPRYEYFGSDVKQIRDELTFDLKISTTHGIAFLKPYKSSLLGKTFHPQNLSTITDPIFIFIEPNRWNYIDDRSSYSFYLQGPYTENLKNIIKRPMKDAFGNNTFSDHQILSRHRGVLSLYEPEPVFSGLVSITIDLFSYNGSKQRQWRYLHFPFEKFIGQCKPLNTAAFDPPITFSEASSFKIDVNSDPSIEESQKCLSIFGEARDHFEEKRYLDKFMFAQDGRDNLRAWLKARNVDTNVRKYYEASENLRDLDETEFERYFSLCYEKYKMERLDYYTNNGILSP